MNDFNTIQIFLSDTFGLTCTELISDKENAEYAGCSFMFNKISIKYRSAKITPTKVGLFVTLWKR
jgi:hypothetical protein